MSDEIKDQIRHLESSLGERMSRIEGQMSSLNAHLDNLSRESAQTNHSLEKEFYHRRKSDERREEWERENKVTNRDLAVSATREVWETFKSPLAYLLTALIAYFVLTYLEGPRLPLSPDRVQVEDAVESR